MHPPAWHPDPLGRHQYRYWDGEQWSEHVADDGRTSLDPIQQDPSAQGEDPSAQGSEHVHTSGTDSSTAADHTSDRPRDTPPPHPRSAETPAQGYGTQRYSGPGQGAGDYAPGAGAGATNGVAVAALVIGILSLLTAFVPVVGLLGVVGGIVAVILGVIGRGKAKQGASGSGMAMGGIITGASAIVIAVLITIALFTFGSNVFGESFRDFNECMQRTGDQELCEQQLEEEIFDNLRN